MHTRAIIFLSLVSMSAALAACFGGGGGGSKTPAATATPTVPAVIDVLAGWVRTNKNVDFVGEWCTTEAGTRGTRRAYYLGPTFSEASQLAIVEQAADGTWTVLSVDNRDPSAESVPGIPWPLQIGDNVVVIGLGDNDCLSIRDQPTQQGNRTICLPDGTKAVIQEGPVDAENFTWWNIAGDGFKGWAAGTWLRLPEAIAQALQPATPTATPQ